MGYTLFIDESGDNGIRKVRTSDAGGATPWFCLGGYLIRDQNYNLIAQRIAACEEEMGKAIHFTKLDQKQRIYVCQAISRMPILCFGTISYKPTLIKKGYAERIRGRYEKSDYYNKNAHYLLEKVGKFFDSEKVMLGEHKIIFEHKEDVNYRRMKNYIRVIGADPHEGDAPYLRNVNPDSISPKRKPQEPLLKIADVIASSIFQACENKVLGIRDTTYVAKIANKFYSGQNGEILNYGLKAIHNISDVGLSDEEQAFFISLNTRQTKVA